MEQSYYTGIDAEALIAELEDRVNRIALDLAVETGKPVEEWIVDVARLLAPSLRYGIRPVDGGHRYVIDRTQGRRPRLGGWNGAALA